MLCYDLLERTHAGWENNEGAHGHFVFDVDEGSIAFTVHERFIAVETFEHRA